MGRLTDRLANVFKRTDVIDSALRYAPWHYAPVRRLLHDLDAMGRSDRIALRSRLSARAFGWAARLPAGLPADVPLRDRPIVEKSELRDRPETFQTRGMLRIPAATSGTTGIPVRLVRSLANIAAEQAFIDDLMGVWNYTFRNAKMARLRADNVKHPSEHRPPFGEYRQGGRKLILSSNHLAPDTVEWFHQELQRMQPEVLFTHPSSGEALARFMQQSGLSLKIPLVLTSSEMLQPSGRQLMEGVFGATVIDYYGLAERVTFADGLAAGAYFFNPAYGLTELLPIAGGEAPPGHLAFEIVATGYWNEAMPLVRYRTGDRAIVPGSYDEQDIEDVTLGLQPAVSIQGRDKEHLISPRGEIIVGLTHAAYGVEGLVRMQVVQERRDAATVRVVVDPRIQGFDEVKLLRNLYDWVPADMRLTVIQVEEIERLASGKTPFVIRRLGAGESA